MACTLTAGRLLKCKDAIGGIKTIFIGAHSDFTSGITTGGTNGEISVLPTANVWRYELSKGVGDFTETITANIENATVFWQQVCNIALHQITAADRAELENVCRGRLVVFVLDNNNNIFMLGRFDSAEVTAGSAATGKAKGDLNGYTMTFTADEKEPARLLETYTADPFDNFVTITVAPAY